MKSTELKDCGSSLAKLKKMTESLITRDSLRVRDIRLFERFLENCPLKVYLWVVNKELKILHPPPHSVGAPQEFFSVFKDELLKNHQEFLSSALETNQCIIGNEEKIYLVTVEKDAGLINGSALEITSRIKMLHFILKISEESKESNENLANTVRNLISHDHFSLCILRLLEAGDEAHQAATVNV